MGIHGKSEVSVVVLTKNSRRTIEQCLKSIVEEEPGEVITLDGLSTDGTLHVLERYGAEVITDASRSLGHLRFIGAASARGAYVMFVDSDAVLGPRCIATMLRELEQFGWAGINATIRSVENVSYWQTAEDEAYALSRYAEGWINRLDSLDHVYMFRAEILKKFHFDAYFVESAEDRDLCFRLAHDGLQVGVSSAVAYHNHRREFSSFVLHRFGYGLGHARFCVRHGTTRTFVEPLTVAYYEMLRGVARGAVRLVPYWLVRGISEFFGVLAGLPGARREIHITQEKPASAVHSG
jgi:glycosyltransferase involved in cell wall biosynthesis